MVGPHAVGDSGRSDFRRSPCRPTFSPSGPMPRLEPRLLGSRYGIVTSRCPLCCSPSLQATPLHGSCHLMKTPALLLPERLKIPGLKTGSIERGLGEAYIAAWAEIGMGIGY